MLDFPISNIGALRFRTTIIQDKNPTIFIL